MRFIRSGPTTTFEISVNPQRVDSLVGVQWTMRSANLSTTVRLQKGEPNRAPATRMAQERGDSESPAMQQEIARETLQDMLLHRFNETTSDCLVHSITTETQFCSQKVLAVTQDEDRVIPIPEATLKRMHTEYGSKASNHQGNIQAGSFVEIGTDSPGCETIADIKTHHVVEGRTIVSVELKTPDPQSKLLSQRTFVQKGTRQMGRVSLGGISPYGKVAAG